MTDIYQWLFGCRGRQAVTDPMPLLPELLQSHAAAIAATIKPMIAITVLDQPPPNGTGSQLGGRAWWPKERSYPSARDRTPLHLLMQIDCGELPSLEPFPDHGLLQFFIGADETYGANLDRPTVPNGFACVFHETVAGGADRTSGPRKLGRTERSPLETPHEPRGLAFRLDQMAVDVLDYRFDKLLPVIADDEAMTEAYATWIEEDMVPAPIRLGGYPTFTQDDPRRRRQNAGIGDVSLLSVDTTAGIMWGDCGAAQFLMTEADLRRRAFSRVAYSWDCC